MTNELLALSTTLFVMLPRSNKDNWFTTLISAKGIFSKQVRMLIINVKTFDHYVKICHRSKHLVEFIKLS